jgi:valyl-tRNA synthetase
MSKTKGNVMDPLDLVGQFGADAVRFTLAALASPGRDLPLDAKRMDGYRSFGTKIWNAARFVGMNLEGSEPELAALDPAALALPERWILAELEAAITAVNRAWEGYRFDEGCRQLYQFLWNDYCDWYVEMAKPVLDNDRDPGSGHRAPEGQGRRPEDVRAVARGVLLEALKLLHPVMPFITEEIARHLGAAGMLMTTAYPAPSGRAADSEALSAMAAFQAVAQETRSYRHLVGLPPGAPLALALTGLDAGALAAFTALSAELGRLAGLSGLDLNPAKPPDGAIHDMAGGVSIAIVLPDGALKGGERDRLAGELDRLEAELAGVRSRLADDAFLARAPEDVVAGARARAAELVHKGRMLAATLGRDP